MDPNWRTLSLCVLLFWQGSLYLAAPIYSTLSLRRGATPATHITEQGKPVMEQRAARWVVAVSMLLIAAFSLIGLLPAPAGLPAYVRFLPVDLSAQELVGQNQERTSLDAGVPTAKITVESANCRSRPRGNAERVTILYKDQEVEIIGRNEDLNNPWWYIKIPNLSGNCWLWGMTSTTQGSLDEVPIIK